jgi:hypothetical protein
MSGKPVRFHPEADQEYLSSLVWYNEATQPRLILKMNSSGQSLPSQKRLSVGRFIFRLAADTFFINSPSASCTAISKKMSSSSPSHTRIGVRDIGENGYGNEAGHCAISVRHLQASSKWTVSRSARCYPDN